jgi:hypothetical protein
MVTTIAQKLKLTFYQSWIDISTLNGHKYNYKVLNFVKNYNFSI